jgi:hypothetical protein
MPRRNVRLASKADGSLYPTVTAEVCHDDLERNASTESERQSREAITEYFAILREWSLQELQAARESETVNQQ